MLKNILEPVKIMLKSRVNKLEIKDDSLKTSDYIEKAKEIWDLIDKDFKISETIDNVVKLKIDKFDQLLNYKFPELTPQAIDDLKRSIIEKVSVYKEKDFKNLEAFKQLQDFTGKLQIENEKLKSELKSIKDALSKNIK